MIGLSARANNGVVTNFNWGQTPTAGNL